MRESAVGDFLRGSWVVSGWFDATPVVAERAAHRTIQSSGGPFAVGFNFVRCDPEVGELTCGVSRWQADPIDQIEVPWRPASAGAHQ